MASATSVDVDLRAIVIQFAADSPDPREVTAAFIDWTREHSDPAAAFEQTAFYFVREVTRSLRSHDTSGTGVRKTDQVDDTDGYDHINRRAITPYGKVYIDGRAKYADAVHNHPCPRCGPIGKPAPAGSPLSDAHKHARALRLVAKAILKDLWREAARIDRDHDAATPLRIEPRDEAIS